MRLRRAVRTRPRQVAAAFATSGLILVSLITVPGLDGLCGAFLAVLMVSIALIDARYFLIPNELTAAAAMLALLRAGVLGPDAGAFAVLAATARGIASALPFFILMIVYRRWRGYEGLGFGDIKLAAVAGLSLGWDTVFIAIEIATLAAIAAYFVAGRRRGGGFRTRDMLPFGLFLAPAIWFGWLIETLWTKIF